MADGLADVVRTDAMVNSDEPGLRIALAQLPARLRRAIRLFHDLTGLSAVTSIRVAITDQKGPPAIVPPVHPRCAALLRTRNDAPCDEEWRRHLRIGRRSREVQNHVCSLGLRCSCIPILYGETLVGIAKFVAGPETTQRRVALAVRALEMAVSQACQDFYVATLLEELHGLRRQVAELQDLRSDAGSERREALPPQRADPKRAPTTRSDSRVQEVLDYVHAHYLDPSLSLASVSRALGLRDKYVTHLFTQVIGQRMHAYIVELRLQHSCQQLLATGLPIKQIAFESGFRQADRFRHAFREQVGVAPSTYRRIFTRT